MSPEKIVYYNKDHANHKGWIDNEGKPWDVPERLFKVVDALLSDDSLNIDWMVSPEFHKETMDLISKVHSVDMIKAISDASKNATLDVPVKTFYDKDVEANTSLIYPGTFEQAIMFEMIKYAKEKLKSSVIYSRHLVSNKSVTALLDSFSFIDDGKSYIDSNNLEWQNIKLTFDI